MRFRISDVPDVLKMYSDGILGAAALSAIFFGVPPVLRLILWVYSLL